MCTADALFDGLMSAGILVLEDAQKMVNSYILELFLADSV